MESRRGVHGATTTTELDSHANMLVVGGQATVIQDTGQRCEVNAFSSEVGTLSQVSIVDAVIAYDCPVTKQAYLLVCRNALYLPSMEHNLVPPFAMREAGLVVDEQPKIHTANPDKRSHSIFEPESGLRIPLQLRGTFSCFPTRALNSDEIAHADTYELVYLSPNADRWDPTNPAWAEMEASFLDEDGEMAFERDPPERDLLGDVGIAATSAEPTPMSIDTFEEAVDATISSAFVGNPQDAECVEECLLVEDAIRAHLASTNATSDPELLSAALADRTLYSKIAMAMGSTTIDNGPCEVFEAMDDAPAVGATTAGPAKGVTAEQLSKVWLIPHAAAEKTLNITSQLCQRTGNSTLSRNLGTNDKMLRIRRIASMFFTDTFFVTKIAKSTRGYICMQIFVSDKGFVRVYGMEHQRDYPKALRLFAKEVGAPDVIVADPHPSQTSTEVKAFLNKIGTTLKILEQGTQWANRAELYVGLIKQAVRKDMREAQSPLVLWDYCAERRALIFSVTARDLFQLQGSNPHTATFGETADISNLCQFGWYEWCWFYDDSSAAKFPFDKAMLGRCLGPSKNEGNEMTQWVLKHNAQVVPRRTVHPLTPAQQSIANEAMAGAKRAFDDEIRERLGSSYRLPAEELEKQHPQELEPDDYFDFVPYEDETEAPVLMPNADVLDAAGKPINQQSVVDRFIHAEVLLPQGESLQMAKVLRRSLDEDGNLVGNFNQNPLLNSMVYDVEFPDGAIRKYAANVIAENVMSHVDPDGHYSHVLECILEHRKDGSAVPKADRYMKTRSGQKRARQTTIGWKFKVKWRNGTTQWLPLSLLKESNPVDVAEYAKARGIDDEPAFAWWVPYTLRKREEPWPCRFDSTSALWWQSRWTRFLAAFEELYGQPGLSVQQG